MNLIQHYIKKFHVNLSFSDSVVLEMILKWPYSIFAFFKLSPFWLGHGPLFEQIWIPFMQSDLHQVWLKWLPGSGEEYFFQQVAQGLHRSPEVNSSHVNTYKVIFLTVALTYPWGPYGIIRNLFLHFNRKLLLKFELFWCSESWDFLKILPLKIHVN
jgi:hypothetical protein